MFEEFLESLEDYQNYKKSLKFTYFNGDYDAADRRNRCLDGLREKCEENFKKYLKSIKEEL